MVTVYCYGEETKWESREEAMDYYAGLMMGHFANGWSAGLPEFERYFTVWANLKAGNDYAPDDDVLW